MIFRARSTVYLGTLKAGSLKATQINIERHMPCAEM